MKSLPFLCLVIILAIIFSSGCSSSQNSPAGLLTPETLPACPEQPSGDGHVLMGIYTLDIDIESETIDVIRNREGEKHWDVTAFLFPPFCDHCFKIAITGYDPLSHIVSVRITLQNPTDLIGYDVRGIILSFGYLKLLNPDSYTKLFGPGTINPFIAWITTNPDRSFHPMQSHSEDIQILNPNWPNFPPFDFVIEASWPGHCKDPYAVNPLDVTDDLKSDGSNTVKIRCFALDWQDNVESVTLDLTPIGGPFSVPMNDLGGGFYEKDISYVSGPGEGYYDLLITATTSDPIFYNKTYNYVTIHVIGPATEHLVQFGNEERISFTSGQSFIWPKHAIAVDSSGNPHVVWADNDPDPYSHLFKIYYTYRASPGGWQTPVVVGSDDVDAIYATMCIDENDVVHIIWEDQRPGQLSTDIYYTNSNSGFTMEYQLTHAGPAVRHAFPRCAYGDGLIHIAWHDNRNDPDGQDWDVYYMSYDFTSGTPGDELVVSAIPGVYEGYPSIDVDADGKIHVAYQQYSSWMQIYHKKKTGAAFGDLHLVGDYYAYQPALYCGNHSQDVFVAFYDYADGSFCDVRLAISNDGGSTFDDVKISSSNTEYQVHPDFMQALNGDLYVAWAEEGYIDVDGTPGPDDLNGDDVINQADALPHRVYFRQRMGQAWQLPITLTGEGDASAFPQLAEGIDKFVHVSYMKWTLDVPYNNYELYYRRSLPWG